MFKEGIKERFLGRILALFLKFIWNTSRVSKMSHDVNQPVIYAMWHGHHFLAPFASKKDEAVSVLISLHRDGEIFASAVENLGFNTIRGAGAHGRKVAEKGGAQAFLKILRAIKAGSSIAMTADVPKISRQCGLGIIMLAEYSGAPIIPVSISSKWHITLKTWDKSEIGLPFSKANVLTGEPIYVEKGLSDEAREQLRLDLEASLNALTLKAKGEA